MWIRVILVGCLGLLACAESPSLRARSAGDMHCPAEELKIYQLDEMAYRVVGCEQEVVYVSVCDAPPGNMARSCTWVVDTKRNPPAGTKPPANSATSEGCSFDTQCKGDRLCVNKQCVNPPRSEPSAAPASSSSAN